MSAEVLRIEDARRLKRDREASAAGEASVARERAADGTAEGMEALRAAAEMMAMPATIAGLMLSIWAAAVRRTVR
ncbi:MAG: hypothetical protein M0002_03305 [Rhodospirillales bacterium]|nr:hypothetical protein [Rhodospirillales bacterium]